jgi:hypothetical protein
MAHKVDLWQYRLRQPAGIAGLSVREMKPTDFQSVVV